jgi:hypothetical protein
VLTVTRHVSRVARRASQVTQDVVRHASRVTDEGDGPLCLKESDGPRHQLWRNKRVPVILSSMASKPITIDPLAQPAYDRLKPREQTELRWGARAVVTGDAPGKRVFGRGMLSFEFRSDITVYVEDRPNEIRIVHIIERGDL